MEAAFVKLCPLASLFSLFRLNLISGAAELFSFHFYTPSQIYTGGLELTDAAYFDAWPSAGTVNPTVSPAPYRKRRMEEQSPFVGGKVCPIGEQACPSDKGFGCVDVKEDLKVRFDVLFFARLSTKIQQTDLLSTLSALAEAVSEGQELIARIFQV